MVTDISSEILSFREMHYAVKAHRRMNLESHFLYFGGVSLIFLGIVFELVMLVDSRRLDGQVIGASLIVCIMALFGMMLIMASRDHKYVLQKERTLVKGWLEKVDVDNPSGSDTTLFYIDNCQLLLPPESDFLCRKNIGQYTEISGVVMSRERTRPAILTRCVSFFNSLRNLEADSTILIVLNYNDCIDIDGVLKRYGLYYFNYLFWINFVVGAVLLSLCGIGMAWFTTAGMELKYPALTCIGLLLVFAVFSVMISVKLEKWVCKRKNFGGTTYLERLSGRV